MYHSLDMPLFSTYLPVMVTETKLLNSNPGIDCFFKGRGDDTWNSTTTSGLAYGVIKRPKYLPVTFRGLFKVQLTTAIQ